MKRRALEHPKRFPFETQRWEHKPYRNCGNNKRGQRQIKERHEVLQVEHANEPVAARQYAEVVDVHHDQREQLKQLRPLTGISTEGFQIFDLTRGCLRRTYRAPTPFGP